MGAGLFSCLALNVCECLGCCVCSCLMKAFSASMSQAARFGHFLILLTMFAIALILGNKYPEQLEILTSTSSSGGLTKSCDVSFTNICVSRQLIYRASASTFLFFFIMAIVSIYTEYINRSFWIIKFIFTIGIFALFI